MKPEKDSGYVTSPRIFCPLCGCGGEPFHHAHNKRYFSCPECRGVFMHPDDALTPEKEKYRYESHKNDVNDHGYRKFVSPIVETVKRNFNMNHSGLDFGCGTGPVASQMLTEQGYALTLYDPFFAENQTALTVAYDYIICCEVIEHFRKPADEFKLLKEILNPGGMLICMTQLINENTNFHEWRYRFDPTHVFFYHKDTVDWMKNRFGFTSADIDGRIIRLIS